MHRFRTLILLAVVSLATACLEASPFVPRIEDVTFAPELGVNLDASTKTASGMYYRDITVGEGDSIRMVADGDTAFIRYTGWLRNGQEFDTNTEAGDPILVFVTGNFGVIRGFEEGVRGMRTGGARQLIIPPALGYGNTPVGGIPANSILVFNVTLTRVGVPEPQ